MSLPLCLLWKLSSSLIFISAWDALDAAMNTCSSSFARYFYNDYFFWLTLVSGLRSRHLLIFKVKSVLGAPGFHWGNGAKATFSRMSWSGDLGWLTCSYGSKKTRDEELFFYGVS